MTRSVSISDFLTKGEIDAAIRLYKVATPGTFATRCADEIIGPNLIRINSSLGQENDPKYLAYMVECAIMLGARSA